MLTYQPRSLSKPVGPIFELRIQNDELRIVNSVQRTFHKDTTFLGLKLGFYLYLRKIHNEKIHHFTTDFH